MQASSQEIQFWAKTVRDAQGQEIPGISVRDHCLNVGCVAEALIKQLPKSLQALLPPGAATLAALHDVGKITPGFQQKCGVWLERNKGWFAQDAGHEPSHSRVSQIFLESLRSGCLHRWSEAMGSHHGRVQGDAPPGGIGGQLWDQARKECLRLMECNFNKLPESDAKNEARQWLLAGLTAVADWLGSDEGDFRSENLGSIDKTVQFRIAERIVERLQLAGAASLSRTSFVEAFKERLKGKPPRPLQEAIISAATVDPGIYVIEDTMGSGKTEAALWLAYRLMASKQARGLYFGLPTRVTSDRIHRRVREFLTAVHPSGIEPPLVHGQSWLHEIPKVKAGWRGGGEQGEEEKPQDQSLAAQRWFASSRRGLLAPFAVGTVDQALLGVIAAKWFFVRQFALAGKIVVLDEVHSYDLYTGTLIARLVRRLRELKATPVILSATLTASQRAKLLGENFSKQEKTMAYPLITIKTNENSVEYLPIKVDGKSKTIQVQTMFVPDFDAVQSVALKAVELASQGQCVLWIRNTVRQAQATYRMLNGEKKSGGFEVGLLHSRYPSFQRGSYPKLSLDELRHRYLHEERWLWMLGKPESPRTSARPRGCILVATQVVEQSVDIDADVLITDLAPTDMLLQRLGRLHRHDDHGERGQPTCWLVVPQPIAERSDKMADIEIKDALGSVGWVYAPYVLLRTWERWSGANQVVLPSEIRDLIEATYDESARKLKSEPAAWKKLRNELADERQRLEAWALNETNVRKPLEEDEEGLGTRYSKQKQILLLIAVCVSRNADRAGNPEEIQLLNGSKLDRVEFSKFNLKSARALHLNTATIPAWWFPKALRQALPPGLAQYFPSGTAMAVYDRQQPQLKLATNNDFQAPTICYHPDEGLWLEKMPAKEALKMKDDGEDDDGMF